MTVRPNFLRFVGRLIYGAALMLGLGLGRYTELPVWALATGICSTLVFCTVADYVTNRDGRG